MFNDRIVFLDLETTGGSLALDRIIEIGLVEIDRGRYVGEWATLVNPRRRIPHAIQVLTGITEEMVVRAPSFDEVSGELAKRLEGKVLAAHNARFDYGFLRSEFLRAGVRYAAPVLCTVKLSRRLFPQHRRHNLDALIMRHAIFCVDRHRALGDARVLWELAQIWHRELEDEALSSACAELLRRPIVPPGLAPEVFDRLPDAPGVFIFYGAGDLALYVGKSANIRSRVIAQFSRDHPIGNDAQISDAVRRVDWIETAGEFGAHIREGQLVNKLGPVYNRQLRRARELYGWHWRREEPATPPQLVDAHDLQTRSSDALYGLFRSRASALAALRELSKTHGLCHALLGLEQHAANMPCSAYSLKRCRGACIGAESALSHAIRLVQALTRLRIKPWPYAGPIGVRERSARGARSELHVIDDWRYLGTVDSDAELYELMQAPPRSAFDLDTYRVLARFLKSPPRSCDILAVAKS